MPIEFGEYTLDDSRRQVLRGAEPLHVSPKAFQLLSTLVESAPKAVSKADLQEQLWPDTFVADGSLAGLVNELRSALGDDSKEPKYIRTLYGFGYAFAAQPAAVDAPAETAPDQPNRRPWAYVAAAVILVSLAVAAVVVRRSSFSAAAARPAIRSIAVLPLDTSLTDRSEQHLGLGLADLLITRLTNVHNLVVRPTSAVRDYAGHAFDLKEVGRKLKVDAVLEGSIRTTADRVRVTVQLVNVRDEKPIWADHFDEKRSEMFALEDDISARVADALVTRLTASERSALAKRYTSNPEAYELYMQGLYKLDRRAREGRFQYQNEAIESFEKAVARDPQYALAWAGLAQAYAADGGLITTFRHTPPRESFEKAKIAAQKALQLDPDLSEAHCAASTIKMYWDLDYAGAEQELRRALELNPRNPVALTQYGYLLQCLRRFDESIPIKERLVEIDPSNPSVYAGLAHAYLTSRKDELGIRYAQTALSMDPHYQEVYIFLIRIYALRGEYDKAIAYGRKLVGMDPSWARGWAFLAYAYGKSGRRAEAEEILDRLEKSNRTPPFLLAVAHLGLDDRTPVFSLLDKALNDRTYGIRLNTEPVLDPLRPDPRFQDLLRRAGFKG